MRSRALPLLLLAGCLEVDGVDLVVDLRAGEATATWQNLRGEGAGDLGAADELAQSFASSWFPRAALLEHGLIEDGETLDLWLRLGFERPEELGLGAWDPRHPYRYCPLPDMVIVQTNAGFRDAQGCAVWARGAEVLRLNLRSTRQSGQGHLLEAWRGAQAGAVQPAAEPPGAGEAETPPPPP